MAQHNAVGRYKVEVINQGFGESKSKGTPFFFLEVRPLALIEQDFETQVDGKYSRTITLYITEKTVERVHKDLAEIGWQGTTFRELDPMVDGHHTFVGQVIIADCQHEGQYEKWELPYEPMSSVPKESTPNLSRKLDALFGKSGPAAKPSTKKPAGKAVTKGDEVAAGRVHDDIPF